MTTIAFDGRFLAADGRATAGGMITNKNTQKIFPMKMVANGLEVNGVLAGAGSFEAICLIKKHLETYDLFDAEFVPELEPESAGVLVILETGEVYILEHKLVPMTQEVPCSIGSGSPYAQAAMVVGKSAPAAVEVAKELDCFSGGKVRVFDVMTWNFVGDTIAA